MDTIITDTLISSVSTVTPADTQSHPTTVEATPTDSKLTSRKFLLTLLCLLLASFLVYTSHIGEGVYSTIVLFALGSYITGNIVQKKV